LISASGVSIFASGSEVSTSPVGFFPFIPNFGKLKSGIFKSNLPDGFSISISRDGPSMSISPLGRSTFASGKLASISAFGFFPLNPNLGRLISGM